jgi:predicted phosphoribosyltransferase
VEAEGMCLAMPEPFQAVGLWYRDFPQTDDDEVRSLPDQAAAEARKAARAAGAQMA